MKKKKKGFTLIELLAVILILGIIALIAIPIVSNILKESKKAAFSTTLQNIVKAVEDKCQLQTLKGETITSLYNFSDGKITPELDLKGKLPTSGKITVDSSCNVSISSVTNGSYTATKNFNEDEITLVDGTPTYSVYTNGTAIYFNPITGSKCTSGEAVSTIGTKTGCMKWFAFNDGGNKVDTIDLLLDHNTTAHIAWNLTGSSVSGPAQILTQLQSDTSSWAGVATRTDSYSVNNGTSTYTVNYNGYKARLITVPEITKVTNFTSYNVNTANSDNWFYMDSNSQTRVSSGPGQSIYRWIFNYTYDCANYGCDSNDTNTSGYLTATATAARNDGVWHVGSHGDIGNNPVTATDFGIRPVITISKSVIQ